MSTTYADPVLRPRPTRASSAGTATVVRLPRRVQPSTTGVRSCRGSEVGAMQAARPAARATTRPVARAAAPVRATSTLRLTRRGRIVVVLFVVAVAGVLLSLGRMSAGAAPAHPAPARFVTVEAGDSLWSVAERVAPGTDPRTEVARLTSVNHLSGGAEIDPGQQLRLP